VSPLGGSSWSSAYCYNLSDGRRVFVKLGRGLGAQAMFDGEARGLRALSATHTLRVPAVLHAGPVADGAMIALEYLELQARVDQARLGTLLGQMHLAAPAPGSRAAAGHFGFDCDNTIGGTPQVNTWSQETGVKGWVAFYRDRRLLPQLRLTRDAAIQRLGDKLMSQHLEALFSDVDDIKPALLHGDLWSGNIHSVDRTPCILDPACYYGHAEAEWGMSWCAGFTAEMYDTYHALVPRSPLFSQRAQLYRLYHYLNHHNLFGDGYRSNCIALLESLTR
jgi:protein-ribulosamine 3-kinase